MKRVKKIGNVEFTHNTLFIKEEMGGAGVQAESFLTGDGSRVVYELEIKTPYLTAYSGTYGWIDESQRAALVDMWNDVGAVTTVTYADDTVENVRMAREKAGEFVFTPLFEGACKFTATIPLCKL